MLVPVVDDIPQLEEAGVVERIVADRGVAYRLTEYGRALGPIVNALGLWGARGLAEPRFGRQRHDPEVPTGDSLAAALIASRTEAVVTPFTVKVSAGPAAAHATVAEHGVEAAPGPDPDTDLRLGGQGLRTLVAGMDVDKALTSGVITAEEPSQLVHEFARAFRAPLDADA